MGSLVLQALHVIVLIQTFGITGIIVAVEREGYKQRIELYRIAVGLGLRHQKYSAVLKYILDGNREYQ